MANNCGFGWLNWLPVLIISDSTLFEINQNNSNTPQDLLCLNVFLRNDFFKKPASAIVATEIISYYSDCSEVSLSSYCSTTLETTVFGKQKNNLDYLKAD